MQITLPTVLWLDANSNNENSSFLLKLRDAENVQTFTEVHACINYIKTHLQQPLFLIVSGTLAVEAVPEIYDLSNVLMVFVFCASMKTYTEWAMDFCEKLLMFDHEDDLMERLWLQTEEYSQEQAEQYRKHADLCRERARKFKQSCG